MSHTRFLPILAASWLAAATACSDALAPADTPVSAPPRASALISLVGFVHPTTEIRGTANLNTDDGRAILLVGANLASVAQVDSAEVEVRGTWTADGAFEVDDFVVRSVEGAPAMDGVLVARYDQATDIDGGSGPTGYDLQLTRGGSVALIDPPADLLAHVGARVWVTGGLDSAPMAFGIIDA
jgi:hypothetical protein